MSAATVVGDFFDEDGGEARVLVYDVDNPDVPLFVTVDEARAGMFRFAQMLEPGSPVRGAWEDMALNGVFGVVFVRDEMAGVIDRFEAGEAS